MPEKIISVPKKPTEATWYIHISNKSCKICNFLLEVFALKIYIIPPVEPWYPLLSYSGTVGFADRTRIRQECHKNRTLDEKKTYLNG